MKIRLGVAAAAALAAPILLPATHALASTTNVASPSISSHPSGDCCGGCGGGFNGLSGGCGGGFNGLGGLGGLGGGLGGLGGGLGGLNGGGLGGLNGGVSGFKSFSGGCGGGCGFHSEFHSSFHSGFGGFSGFKSFNGCHHECGFETFIVPTPCLF